MQASTAVSSASARGRTVRRGALTARRRTVDRAGGRGRGGGSAGTISGAGAASDWISGAAVVSVRMRAVSSMPRRYDHRSTGASFRRSDAGRDQDHWIIRGVVGALVACGVAAAAILALAAGAPRWQAWAPATCLPFDCFCEAIRAGAIRQPANTWSNLGFIAVGGAILGAGGSRAFGAAAIFAGAGSAVYHASFTFW